MDIASIAFLRLFWCFTIRRTGSVWFAIGFHATSVLFARLNPGRVTVPATPSD